MAINVIPAPAVHKGPFAVKYFGNTAEAGTAPSANMQQRERAERDARTEGATAAGNDAAEAAVRGTTGGRGPGAGRPRHGARAIPAASGSRACRATALPDPETATQTPAAGLGWAGPGRARGEGGAPAALSLAGSPRARPRPEPALYSRSLEPRPSNRP